MRRHLEAVLLRKAEKIAVRRFKALWAAGSWPKLSEKRIKELDHSFGLCLDNTYCNDANQA